jgi:hypothetical protein
MVADVDVAFRQQAQHLGVLRGDDLTQRRRPQRGDRDRQGVVGIVLVRPPRAQHTDPRRERRRHVQDGLARSDQLLGQQVAEPAGGLDRPRSLTQRFGPPQQLWHLLAGRPDPGPCELSFAAVDRHRGVRRLVWVDADDH